MKKKIYLLDGQEEVKGWVEIKDGKIVVGNLGFRVWKHKKDIKEEGFSDDEIVRVAVYIY